MPMHDPNTKHEKSGQFLNEADTRSNVVTELALVKGEVFAEFHQWTGIDGI